MPTARRGRFGTHSGGNAGDLREVNLTRILGYVRDHGTSSRHDIAAGVGLGISTMTDLVGELRARRLLLELPPVRRPTAGRPTRPIAIDGAPWMALGVHVDVDAVELRAENIAGALLWSAKVDADLRGPDGPDTLRKVLAGRLGELPEEPRLSAVQVGVPGTVDPVTGSLRSSVALGWSEVGLADLVRDQVESAAAPTPVDGDRLRVAVANDTQLAGLHAVRAEIALPSAAVAAYVGGMRSLAGAVVLDGDVFRGAGGNAGDLGHHHVDPAGEQCWCGRRGCLETFAGLRWLLERGGLRSADDAVALAATSPRAASGLVADAARRGDGQVLSALDSAGGALARCVDDVIGTVSPDTVVLGGQLGLLAEFVVPVVTRELGDRLVRGPRGLDPLVAVGDAGPRVVLGAVLAARDAVLADPLRLTQVMG